MKKTMVKFLPNRTATLCFAIASFLFSFSHMATAQHRIGLANTNYGGITNLMSNPADIAGARYKTYIGLGQFDAHLTNNYFKFGGLNINFTGNGDSLAFLKKGGNYLSLGIDLGLWSLMQSITPKITVGLSSRVRGLGQGVGITQNLFVPIGLSDKDQVADIKGAGLNVGAQLFSELDLSYAQTLVDNQEYSIKVGTTIKRLSGGFSTGISLSGVDGQYTKSQNADKYKITNGQLIVAYGGLGSLDSATSFSPSNAFGSKGKGWGFDLGATYEHRTGALGESSNGSAPYLFRVGASLTDFGNIKYSGTGVRYYTANLKNVNLDSDSMDITSADELLQKAGINLDSSVSSFRSAIPTMLRVNADVRLSKLFFVNLNVATNLVKTYQLGTRYASFIALTPRLETRYFDFSLPLALMNNYKTFGMGFAMRLGPVTFGMDNFTGFAGSASGFNGHAGLNIGIGRRANAQDLAAKEKAKEKEEEVVEARTESKEKSKKKSKKAPKEDPLSGEDMKAPDMVAAPKPVQSPASNKKEIAKNEPTPPQEIAAPSPSSAPKMEDKKPQAPASVAVVPKPTASAPTAKPAAVPAKVPASVAVAPKPSAPVPTAKPADLSKTPASVTVAPKPSVKSADVPAKAPASTVVASKPSTITLSPVGSGKMGECIEFFPNKAAISGNSMACLREISKFLTANKSIKLNVTGSILATEKPTDGAALKLERAKTVRNFLIQSGVEAARLSVKTGDSVDAPIILSAQ